MLLRGAAKAPTSMQLSASSILCILSSAVLFASTASSQTSAVVPTGIGDRPGAASTSVGVGDTTARAQYLYSRSATGLRGGERITKLSLRLDEAATTPGRNDLDVTVRISTRAVDTSRIPFARFDLNDGLVVGAWTMARLVMPAVITTQQPQPFLDLPLATPFIVDVDGTLCVDVKFRTAALGPFPHRVDCEFDPAVPFRFENYGRACPPTLTSGATGFWVGNTSELGAYTWVRGAPAGSAVVAWLDVQRSNIPISLRYNQDPCSVYALLSLLHPRAAVVNQGGDYARFQWLSAQSLADPKLVGTSFVAQHGMVDPSFQIGLSDGIEIVIGDGKASPDFVTVYGSSRERPGFDPDLDDASSFWSGAPVLRIGL